MSFKIGHCYLHLTCISASDVSWSPALSNKAFISLAQIVPLLSVSVSLKAFLSSFMACSSASLVSLDVMSVCEDKQEWHRAYGTAVFTIQMYKM